MPSPASVSSPPVNYPMFQYFWLPSFTSIVLGLRDKQNTYTNRSVKKKRERKSVEFYFEPRSNRIICFVGVFLCITNQRECYKNVGRGFLKKKCDTKVICIAMSLFCCFSKPLTSSCKSINNTNSLFPFCCLFKYDKKMVCRY
ncbi:transmembrane protein, putative [Bodo saltans]|uniref:Transmembrane protein, putative n=1 Tax=Bodo saltans TaxID=75058 RepID=A0A0S4JG78_BODSA|nr:transmembrane protein, putative [Bodo saltans]|eukprot:CUG87399.1 transmembrane protein, putative [Bodo saltans]